MKKTDRNWKIVNGRWTVQALGNTATFTAEYREYAIDKFVEKFFPSLVWDKIHGEKYYEVLQARMDLRKIMTVTTVRKTQRVSI